MRSTITALTLATTMLSAALPALATPPKDAPALLPVEHVAALTGAMPTGVTVAPSGRIFLNYPQWGDKSPFAVAELKDGKVSPYPDTAFNQADTAHADQHLISVQSVVADGANRLWILDTGAPGFAAPIPGGAKLVAVDLATDQVVRTIVLGDETVLPTTYLNDVRFDLRQGSAGVAYITDSSVKGPGGLIVVDLATGKALRRLSGHPTTMPDPGFKPTVEGKVLMSRPKGQTPSPWLVATDGIAISADGATLYYCALSSRHFYAVPTALLRDPSVTDATIAAAIRDLGPKAPSDGLAEDDKGRLYAGDYEHGTIRRFEDVVPSGGKGKAGAHWQTIAKDPAILWPDTLSVGTDGYLYFTANQLYRQAGFNEGVDKRRQPYELLRIRIDAGPVLLK
ncbi:L-dopachrome tautomerase-related protein [Nitrospirillum amazonense]|uniref:Sugar lactone lactonase YvrE n=1 Tax=Nitrospirillum amazonense TaxID=28077 RepID=A0A560J683_9PROT|nr:L-dopachrome tautomerase-related protein [Nitrospirillum amazonense]MDG3439096.1 L-dopachrome tautomerase-related protein [Nitrospirillum amazonense]TWB65969.1 sugar lactone lactonase YvrE [Nitrospirillum amazonense]